MRNDTSLKKKTSTNAIQPNCIEGIKFLMIAQLLLFPRCPVEFYIFGEMDALKYLLQLTLFSSPFLMYIRSSPPKMTVKDEIAMTGKQVDFPPGIRVGSERPDRKWAGETPNGNRRAREMLLPFINRRIGAKDMRRHDVP